jgi:hypothetical protein
LIKPELGCCPVQPSFGIIVWEMVTAQVPWQGKSMKCICKNVCVKDKRPELPADCECPVFLRQVMTECWAPDPADRPSFEALVCPGLKQSWSRRNLQNHLRWKTIS